MVSGCVTTSRCCPSRMLSICTVSRILSPEEAQEDKAIGGDPLLAALEPLLEELEPRLAFALTNDHST